jgi:hypothetical protein
MSSSFWAWTPSNVCMCVDRLVREIYWHISRVLPLMDTFYVGLHNHESSTPHLFLLYCGALPMAYQAQAAFEMHPGAQLDLLEFVRAMQPLLDAQNLAHVSTAMPK